MIGEEAIDDLYASMGARYHEAFLRSGRRTRDNIAAAVMAGWDHYDILHWMDTGEQPDGKEHPFDECIYNVNTQAIAADLVENILSAQTFRVRELAGWPPPGYYFRWMNPRHLKSKRLVVYVDGAGEPVWWVLEWRE